MSTLNLNDSTPAAPVGRVNVKWQLSGAQTSAYDPSDKLLIGFTSIPVTGLKFPNAVGLNLPIGDNDLYTCPAGKMALVVETTYTNPLATGHNITAFAEVFTGGAYTIFDFVVLAGVAGTTGGITILMPFLLRVGERFAVNTSATGLSVWAFILEFDDTAPILDARLLTLASGDNTLFTCPGGKSVALLGLLAGGFAGAFPPSRGIVNYYNKSGAARNIQVNIVPSGSSPSLANAIQVFNGLLNNQSLQVTYYGGLAPGDFINVNTNAATASQCAWIIYRQLP